MTDRQTALRLASTVILLRDGQRGGVEMFMVKRHRKIEFASGALVFPGGSLDPGDSDPELRDYVKGGENLSDEELAFRIAAIRECFEEAGVLLAYDRQTGRLVDGTRYDEIDELYRRAVTNDEIAMKPFAEKAGLIFACDALVPYAHWLTPDFLPKRFDTWFFVAQAPVDHLEAHDEYEVVDSLWISPADALEAAAKGDYVIVFATRLNIEKLGNPGNVEEALAAARKTPTPLVKPWLEEMDGKSCLTIQGDAGYSTTQAEIDAVMKRAVKKSPEAGN